MESFAAEATGCPRCETLREVLFLHCANQLIVFSPVKIHMLLLSVYRRILPPQPRVTASLPLGAAVFHLKDPTRGLA